MWKKNENQLIFCKFAMLPDFLKPQISNSKFYIESHFKTDTRKTIIFSSQKKKTAAATTVEKIGKPKHKSFELEPKTIAT